MQRQVTKRTLTPQDRELRLRDKTIGTHVPSPGAPTEPAFPPPAFPPPAFPGTKSSESALRRRHEGARPEHPSPPHSTRRFPPGKGPKNHERVWPGAVAPFRSHLRRRGFGAGARSVGPSPQVRRTTLRNHRQPPALRRARARDPEPRPRAAWQPEREWGGPAPSRGTRGRWGDRGPCGTGTAQPLAERVSRQKGPKRGGRGLRAANGGEGPAERVRAPSARMQHCDKAARAPGWGAGGQRLQGPSISIRISHFMPPRIVPPSPHLKE